MGCSVAIQNLNHRIRIIMRAANLNESSQSIKFSSLVIMGRLGRGSTSHVFKTQSIKTKQFYAMKVIDKFDSNYSLALLQRELAIHRKLSNQHVVQLIEHMEDSENHYLLAEYCADGEATKFLLDRNIGEETVRRVAHDVSCGLDYLHNEARIAHGDVKLSNILISNHKIKLCDFGFSMPLDQPPHSSYGTLMYSAPEVLANGFVDSKAADVWALGICLLTLMLGRSPYLAASDQQLRQAILKGKIVSLSQKESEFFSADLLKIVGRMLEKDPTRRITAAESRSLLATKSKPQTHDRKKMTPEFRKSSENKKNPLKPKLLQSSCSKKSLTRSASHINLKRKVLSPTNAKLIKQKPAHPKKIKQHEKTIEYASDSCNQTADTSALIQDYHLQLLDSQTNFLDFRCLKPQIQKMKDSGYVEIKKDHCVKIKVKNVTFSISINPQKGPQLELEKKNGSTQAYDICQIENLTDEKERTKVRCLYEYATEVISVMKKRQCQIEFWQDDIYFWMERIQPKTNLQPYQLSFNSLVGSSLSPSVHTLQPEYSLPSQQASPSQIANARIVCHLRSRGVIFPTGAR